MGFAAPKLVIGPAGSVPMVWGIISPCLLLPEDTDEWPDEKLRAVLLHELAHLRRHDPAALLLCQTTQALHWFNPLVWLTVRRLREDQERACDDDVLRHGIRASDYAQHLFDISQHNRLAPGLGLCALAMARSAPVESRLSAILDPHVKRDTSSRGAFVVSLIAAAVVSLPLAMLANEAASGLRGRILDRHGVVLAESTKEKVRVYPLQTLVAHVVGYTGKSGPKDLTPIGRAAMERQHDAALTRGKDVALSLDTRIQGLVTSAVKDAGFERGAVVVLDPRTGEILASVSLPSYDPNRFVPTISADDFEAYVKDTSLPLLDRCLHGQYCPGSAFVPFTALAGIAAGVGENHFDCTGSVEYGGKSYRCWIAGQNPAGHGRLAVTSALVASCNCYWYQFGNAAGPEAFLKMGHLVGIGEATGVLDDDAPGLLPSPAWLAAKSGSKDIWKPAHTANLAIGQGYLLTTPLQLAVLAATLGNGGKVPKPTLTRVEKSARPNWRADLIAEGLPANQIELVREGMRLVVNGDGGTGKAARSERVVIAGKTGTAQYWRRIGGETVKENHVCFMGFAPFESPTLAFAVLLEGGRSGGSDAAPIAKRIVEETLALPVD
jgi:cell division protein FtsI/penicillin-binding protein 2